MSFPEKLLTTVMLMVVTLAPLEAHAQVPDTDIWVADISVDERAPAPEGGLRLGRPVNVTKRPGYDNQPCFLPGGSGFLFTRADSMGTDIYRWDESSGIVRVTNTPESEYSPTPMDPPGSGFCVVRVEADSTQRLWRFDMDGSNPRLVSSEVDSVGYFAWIDEGHVAVFVLGNEARKEPHTLRVVDVATQRETIIARGIGRALHRLPGTRDLSFSVEKSDTTYQFFLLPHGSRQPVALIPALGRSQDAAWLGNRFLMAQDAMICKTVPQNSGGRVWHDCVDLSEHGITTITRIAASPDQRRIAFVTVAKAP